jgi:hypothetical protein
MLLAGDLIMFYLSAALADGLPVYLRSSYFHTTSAHSILVFVY